MAGSFRFLHASDFHLDQPLGGLTELPESLIDPLMDATYKSVDRVFDVAISERVDFVVLSGDLIHFPTATPKALEFLRAQLDRLREKKVPVYWLGGQLEAGHPLPPDFALPKNVQRLNGSRVQKIDVKRDNKTIAYVVGQSAGSTSFVDLQELRCPRDGRFFVGMWYGDIEQAADRDQMDDLGIDYWALGGRHNSKKLETMIPAEYCGTPQGRLPAEHGPHGCVLVKVDGNHTETQFIDTDAIRYRTEKIALQGETDRQQVVKLVSDRMRQIEVQADKKQHLLLTWEVIDDGPLGRELRRIDGAEHFLTDVQRATNNSSDQRVWSIALRSLRATIPSSLFDEDSMLGDFLRVVRDMEQSGDSLLDVQAFLPNTPAAHKLAESLHLKSAAARRELLREVTTIGIDMLSGETA